MRKIAKVLQSGSAIAVGAVLFAANAAQAAEGADGSAGVAASSAAAAALLQEAEPEII